MSTTQNFGITHALLRVKTLPNYVHLRITFSFPKDENLIEERDEWFSWIPNHSAGNKQKEENIEDYNFLTPHISEGIHL